MKREGRQHGMVRTYRILPDASLTHTPRFVNQIHTQPMAGVFAKVSSKPTNHSKSTGLSNSNNKIKRPNKHKCDVTFNHGIRFSGVSASVILNSFYQHEDHENDPTEHHDHELEDAKGMSGKDEGSDDIVVYEDGCAATIGEMVILLERINEEDWWFVGADA